MPRSFALILTLLAAPAFAASPAQIQSGQNLARQYCSECHVVAPSPSKGWTDAPAFDAIANNPSNTAAKLAQFIEQPHMHMMNTGRPAPEAAALAAYILSLKGK